jgi:cell division protein FtsB
MAIYQQVNLYQPIFRKQRQVFSARTMAQAVALVAIALLAIYAYGVWKLAGLDADVVQLEGREKAFTAQVARIDPNLGANRRAEVEREIKDLNATLLDQQRLIEVLRDQPLGSTEGFSAYLAALGRQHTPLLWLTNLTINGATRAVDLGGRSVRAELVPEYLQHLGSEKALEGQRFDRLDIERDKESAEIAFHVTSRKVDARADETLAARKP